MDIKVKEFFSSNAPNYDSERRSLVPCFDDFYGVAVELIESSTEDPQVLDLGCGTGLLSYKILQKYPSASYTLIDISNEMIGEAKKRFEGKNINFIHGDYLTFDFAKKFDIIVSGLSIHHIENEEKQILFQKIYSILNLNGIFVNCDQALGESDCVHNTNIRRWRNFVRSSGLSQYQIDAWERRIVLDREVDLIVQLDWLRNTGFHDVSCYYKYYNFVVYKGVKK